MARKVLDVCMEYGEPEGAEQTPAQELGSTN